VIFLAKIFLVDDDGAIIEAYHNMLEIRGHEVIGEAFDGENAVNVYKELPIKPDIILMDHRMPLKSGMAAMEEIHAINPTQCIIFITADYEAAKIALKEGADSFIMKPFRMDDMFNSIEMALAQSKKRSSEFREIYIGYITKLNEAGDVGNLSEICDMIEKKLINSFITESSLTDASIDTIIECLCEFYNIMSFEYSYEREQDKFIIKNKKCIWMDEFGPNPSFCFMSKCVISKFAIKSGKKFELSLNEAIMAGSDECVFELTLY